MIMCTWLEYKSFAMFIPYTKVSYLPIQVNSTGQARIPSLKSDSESRQNVITTSFHSSDFVFKLPLLIVTFRPVLFL